MAIVGTRKRRRGHPLEARWREKKGKKRKRRQGKKKREKKGKGEGKKKKRKKRRRKEKKGKKEGERGSTKSYVLLNYRRAVMTEYTSSTSGGD